MTKPGFNALGDMVILNNNCVVAAYGEEFTAGICPFIISMF